MVKEHDNLLPGDLLASVQNQIDDCLKMCFAGCQMSWVDVICFESCKVKLTRSYIIASIKRIDKDNWTTGQITYLCGPCIKTGILSYFNNFNELSELW